jgi:hypothetical protein
MRWDGWVRRGGGGRPALEPGVGCMSGEKTPHRSNIPARMIKSGASRARSPAQALRLLVIAASRAVQLRSVIQFDLRVQ